MVLAGVAPHNIYEKCLFGKPVFYFRYKNRTIIDFSHPGNFGKSCLDEKKSAISEDEMRPGGWIFLIISWGLILGLSALCFIKVFSRKELR